MTVCLIAMKVDTETRESFEALGLPPLRSELLLGKRVSHILLKLQTIRVEHLTLTLITCEVLCWMIIEFVYVQLHILFLHILSLE